MKYQITHFAENGKFSFEISDFAPKGGYEIFLNEFCQFTGESLYDWFQGVESGIGHMSYLGTTLTIVWNDVPDSLHFDCDSEELAVSLQEKLGEFFHS